MITPIPAPKIQNKKLAIIPFGYAGILLALSVWQLVMFDDFAPYIAGYIGTSTSTAAIVAMILIGLQVFALPFLLRLRLSPLARFCSALFAFITPLAWAAASIMGSTFTATYLLLNVSFFLWGGLSFWVLGGPKVMRLQKR